MSGAFAFEVALGVERERPRPAHVALAEVLEHACAALARVDAAAPPPAAEAVGALPALALGGVVVVGGVDGVGVTVADVAGAVGEFLSAADLTEAVFKTRLSRDRGFTQFAGEALIVGGGRGVCAVWTWLALG